MIERMYPSAGYPSGMSMCVRNLPQHFNGCVCTPAAGGTMTAEADIDLTPVPYEETTPETGWLAAIRRAFQDRALQRLAPAAGSTDQAPRRWHSRILDQMLRHTAPATNRGLKHALKGALTRGGLACAAVLCAVLPYQYGESRNVDVEATLAAPGWDSSHHGLASQYECSDTGLPDGVDAVHGLVLDKTSEADPALKVVPFDRAQKIHESGRDDLILVAVCSE